MINIRKRRASDLEFYVNTFIFSVEGYLEKRDYNDVVRNLDRRSGWEEEKIIPNQKLTHDFACESLAPLLAVAVELKPLLKELGLFSPERAAIRGMYFWIVETVEKYCKKYGLDYEKLLSEVRRQVPLGNDGFMSSGYHISNYNKEGYLDWRERRTVDFLAGGFFLDNPKMNFSDCDASGVRHVSL